MQAVLAGQTVLITGAGRGIGRAIARRFASQGARVVLHYHRRSDAAEETLAALEPGDHWMEQADLSDPQQVETLVARVLGRVTRLHVLVNNAGIFVEQPLLQRSWAEWQQLWQQTIALNLSAAANLSFLAARHMAEQGGGKIINITSRGAFRAEPDAPEYGASKAGLNSLSQSMARALAPHGVMVYAVAPGFVDTDMVAGHLKGERGREIRAQSPLGRVADPQEIASVVSFLAGPDTDYLTGAIIDANGASYLRN